MNKSFEAHYLAIKNISIIEAAYKVLDEAAKHIFDKTDEIIRGWVSKQIGWDGEFDLYEEDTYFYKKSWKDDIDNDNDNLLLWFGIGYIDKEDLHFWLSNFLNLKPGKFGLLLSVDSKKITNIKGSAKANNMWRKFLNEQFLKTSLSGLGFSIEDDGVIFLPIIIDSQMVVDDYENLDDALSPINDALDKIEQALPDIDMILKAAKKYQFQ